MLTRLLALVALGASLGACDRDICAIPAESSTAGTIRELAPAEVAALIERDPSVLVVDVNPQDIYDEGHLPGARHMSSSDVSFDQLPPDRGSPIVFYCYNKICGASHQAASSVAAHGWKNVIRMPEGITGWKAAGLPVESGVGR